MDTPEQVETTTTAETETVTATPTPEDYKKLEAALKDANKEAASRRKKLEAFEKAEADRQAADMTELEKAQAKAKEYEAEILNAKRETIAARYGLPEVLAQRLQGATIEEIEEDAKILVTLIPQKSQLPNITASSPAAPSILSVDTISKMTTAEINKQWDAVSAALSKNK